ncbi:Maf-like protein [Clostridium sp. YIM B02506]|uniref:Maf-like protein n=1 Tax=Clostridium sp. YIM B02506 TaxID=2910680 RepID=UPI000FB06FEB
MGFVLASASERRKELLTRLCEEFRVIESFFPEEKVVFNGNLEEYVKELSLGKAKYVADNLDTEDIIIAADTIVAIGDLILGKPKDKDDAYNMLKSLSGKVHNVYTGVTVLDLRSKKIISEAVCTEVKFSHLSDEEILSYVDSGDPLDKAGAYGIQGRGGVFVERIEGCYYNVVGLPLNKLDKMLKSLV